MKMNIKGIALFVLLAGTINLFTACSDDEEEEPLDKTPTINFIGGGDYTSSDVTVPAGTVVKVGITATANTNSNAKLVKFKVTRTFNNVPETVIDSTLNNLSSFTYTRNIQARTEAGTERYQRVEAVAAEPMVDGFGNVVDLLGQVDQVFGEA